MFVAFHLFQGAGNPLIFQKMILTNICRSIKKCVVVGV